MGYGLILQHEFIVRLGTNGSQGDLSRFTGLRKVDLCRANHFADKVSNFHGDTRCWCRPIDLQYAKVFPEVAIAHSVRVFFFAGSLRLVHGAGGDFEKRVG